VSVSANGHAGKSPRISSISPEHVEPLDPELEDYLNQIGDRVEADCGTQVHRVVLEGTASRALTEFDTLSHPDMIVMSTHGRGPLSRAWIGSVADRITRHVSTPVVLVRPREAVECEVTRPAKLRRILVPLDGSDLAEASLVWAKRIMQATDASCTLMRVANESFPAWSSHLEHGASRSSDYTRLSEATSREYLDGVCEAMRQSGFEVDTVVETEGPDALAILRCAQREAIDLIVMASHGRGGLRRLVLGSVADKVVRAADVPVLMIRPDQAAQ
jgi:nucleotide-binding universal stress UspA family protein